MKFRNRVCDGLLALLACASLLSWVNPRAGRAQDQDPEENFDFDKELEQTSQLIVMLSVEFDGAPEFGAGIIFGREKDRLFIATAYHVLHRGTEHPPVYVKFKTMPDKSLVATFLKHDEGMDLAVISVDVTKQNINPCALPFARLGNAAELKRADAVSAVGNPNGVPWATSVEPEKLARISGSELVFQSTFIRKGHSGGGLLDKNANLVGMTTADEPPFGRATNIDVAMRMVQQWGYPVHLRTVLVKGMTALHMAAKSSNVAEIRDLLAYCGNANAKDDHDAIPLHFAAAYGTPEAMSLLVKAGADLNARDGDGDPPLEWAVAKGLVENVNFLIKSGADINLKNKSGRTLLHKAAELGQLETVRVLVTAGANVNVIDRGGDSPLDRVATSEHLELMRFLAGAGAKASAQSLYWSLKPEKTARLKILLKAVADINAPAEGETLLHVATERGELEIVKLLVMAGAKVNTPGRLKRTALYVAIEENQTAVKEYLLAHGAGVKGIETWLMEGLLWHALDTDQLDALRLILGEGIDPNTRAGRARIYSLLNWAIEKEKPMEFIKALVKAGADINQDDSGMTPLARARHKGQAAVVKVLLEAGAKEDN